MRKIIVNLFLVATFISTPSYAHNCLSYFPKQDLSDPEFADSINNIQNHYKLIPKDCIKYQNNQNKTLLMYAAEFGLNDSAIYMIKNGASINSKDDNHWSPLMYSTTPLNDGTISRLLLVKKANINMLDKHKNNALHLAAKYDNLEVVKVLLEFNANSQLKNIYEQKPIDLSGKKTRALFIEKHAY